MFTEPSQAVDDVPKDVLLEDAETCLTVFEALSISSDAARRARDMMQGLRASQKQGRICFGVELQYRIANHGRHHRCIAHAVFHQHAMGEPNGLHMPGSSHDGSPQYRWRNPSRQRRKLLGLAAMALRDL